MTTPENDTISRIYGSLIGGAIGDALGYPVEFTSQTPNKRIVFDLMNRDLDGDGSRVAFYSDDTQLTRAVAEGLILGNGHFDVSTKAVAAAIVAWAGGPDGGHRAPGGACLHGAANLRAGVNWDMCGKFENGGGCGAAMRSAPYGWLFNRRPVDAADWAARHAKMTHRHPIGLASAAATAVAVSRAFTAANRWQVADAAYQAARHYDEGTAHRIAYAMRCATQEGQLIRTDEFVLDKFRGFSGHEAIAASIYCFLRHWDSYRDAVLLAVNSPGDSDSLGAITGSISGAFLGINAIPEEWVAKIEKRSQLFDLAGRFVEMLGLEPSTIDEPQEKEI
jgi:ADP-ribosylglycohydrolase